MKFRAIVPDILKEPYVREWAEGLKSYLEQAQASTAASKSSSDVNHG